MNSNNQEARILLAIEAIQKDKKISIRKVAKMYNISNTTLQRRINSFTPRSEYRSKSYNLSELEENIISKYILDMDMKGFPSKFRNVEDIMNHILESRGAKCVGKLWVYRFVKHRIELKMCFSCIYDFQRALCEDPKLIEEWFRLVSNMRAKYGILDSDFYNFDETDFMMGIICVVMVVTSAERCGRSKSVQSDNREWATAIICENGEGETIPSFLVVQGQVHLSNWYTETDFLVEWVIKSTSNG